MVCGTGNIPHNIPHIETVCEEYYVEYCQSHNDTVMNLNNFMLTWTSWIDIHAQLTIGTPDFGVPLGPSFKPTF